MGTVKLILNDHEKQNYIVVISQALLLFNDVPLGPLFVTQKTNSIGPASPSITKQDVVMETKSIN